MKYESTRKAINKYRRENKSVLVFFGKIDGTLLQKLEETAKKNEMSKPAYIKKILRETLKQSTKQAYKSILFFEKWGDYNKKSLEIQGT